LPTGVEGAAADFFFFAFFLFPMFGSIDDARADGVDAWDVCRLGAVTFFLLAFLASRAALSTSH